MIVNKVWGYELWIVNNDKYCGKRLFVREGWKCSLHRHRLKDETFYVESGAVRFELGNIERIMYRGHSAHVPSGTWHRFAGLEDSVIFEFSTHHDDADVERQESSGRIL